MNIVRRLLYEAIGKNFFRNLILHTNLLRLQAKIFHISYSRGVVKQAELSTVTDASSTAKSIPLEGPSK